MTPPERKSRHHDVEGRGYHPAPVMPEERERRDGLEGAPIPVPGHAGGRRIRLMVRIHPEVTVREGARGAHGLRDASRVARRGAVLLRVQHALDLVEAGGARFFPSLIGAPAQVTGAGGDSLGMEASALIQRHDVRRMGGAEDMAAVAAMVSAQEEAKGGPAGGRIAAGRSRIGLGGVLADAQLGG
jgi:hypothetical protein